MDVDVPGTTIAVSDEGDGPPVVLVHSGVGDRSEWDAVAARLPGRRVVRLDLRGFGDSAMGTAPFAHHADVLAVMDARGLDRVTLVGASFGGLVALETAAEAPERLGRLVLLAPALFGREVSDALAEFGSAEDAALERGDLDGAVRLNVEQWAGRLDPDVQAAVAARQRRAFELQLPAGVEAAELDPPVAERLAAIAVETDVLVGDADLPDFPEIAGRLAAELPRARLTVLPDVGHLIAVERPDDVAAIIDGTPVQPSRGQTP